MAVLNINLTYKQLSSLLEKEINKQNINIKGYNIAVSGINISEEQQRLRVRGHIHSKWDASIDFSAFPEFVASKNKLELKDMHLHLDAKHLIFKGILKLAQGNIKSRIEKILDKPLSDQLEIVKELIDKEASKASLPHNLALNAKTSSITIKKFEVLPTHLSLSAVVDQEINISFK